MTLKSMIPATVALVLTGCQSMSNQPQQTNHASQAVYTVEYHAAQHFAAETRQLHQQFVNYCQLADLDRDSIKQQWHSTMLAWMALQGQERGPATALAQSWNVQFWPDKKNTTGRKMTALLKQKKSWQASDIAQQSVTVQGLGALEWVLYDPSSPFISTPKEACSAVTAISENLADNAGSIAHAWRNNPWTGTDASTWHADYIALLTNQLEYSMSKLSRPLAKIGQPRPYFSESWRSKTSMLNLRANIVAMQALYLAALDSELRAKQLDELADRVKTQYANLIETWPNNPSLFDMLQSKDGYRDVLSQYNKLEQLKYLLHDEVAVELGVVIGFNSSDGD